MTTTNYGESVAGKVAVVTGGARGIGRGYALGLAAAGADVVVADIRDIEGQETVGQIEKEGGRAIFAHTDVSDEQSTVHMAEAAAESFGGVDVLVNNAALLGGTEWNLTRSMDISVERWNRMIGVNLTGAWLSTRAVFPSMRTRGGGVIVNQSSIGAYRGNPMMADYCAAKAGLIALTKALARDLAEYGIRVNAIVPGAIATEACFELTGGEQQWRKSADDDQLIKEYGSPEHLVGPLLFLISDASRFMTGQALVADGGVIFPA